MKVSEKKAAKTSKCSSWPQAPAEATIPSAATMSEVEVKVAHKAPPPEKPAEIKTRGWVVFSFWAVVIFLGLPVWLWTTSIHRAALPLQEMLEWADGKVWAPKMVHWHR